MKTMIEIKEELKALSLKQLKHRLSVLNWVAKQYPAETKPSELWVFVNELIKAKETVL